MTAGQPGGRRAAVAAVRSSAVPADGHPAGGTGQGQALRFGRDRIAFRIRQQPPRLHRDHRVGPAPRPGDLPCDEQGAGPDARSPQRAAALSGRDQQVAIGSVPQEIGIAAGQQPRACRRLQGSAERRLVLGEDVRVPASTSPMRAARSSARRRRLASSGRVPRVKTATSCVATTKTLNRGPHTWTSAGSSQMDGSASSTRAWIDSSAARGMLSCSPAQAACRSDSGRRARRASRPPAFRRKARIWARVRSSRAPATLVATTGVLPGPGS